uniref:MAP3K_TRAF_bd domain-containing protein n=1 Tax=Macrostomum lignano TaxID=282301 RepID=A0A1I8IXP1_9PLAT
LQAASLHSQQAASSGGAAAAAASAAGSTSGGCGSASRLRVVCVVDQTAPLGTAAPASPSLTSTAPRQKAFADVERACKRVGLTCISFGHIINDVDTAAELFYSAHAVIVMLTDLVQFTHLDYGTTTALHEFYNSEVAITEMSTKVQQYSILYHLGVRESLGMRDNIILVHDLNKDETDSLRNSLSASYRLFPYLVDDSTGRCVVPDSACHKLLLTNCHTGHDHGTDSLLLTKLKRALREVESTSKAQLKEKFLDDLQKARLEYKGDCLKEFLRRMRSRLDDPDLISPDIILNMLLSYRKAQDYSAMVGLVEELKTLPHAKHLVDIVSIQNLYAFALNRRNRPGDRKEALEVILRAVQRCDKPVPDMLSLVQPNEYSGINLATLLVVSGQELSSNSELQRVALVLNNLIGKKGSLRDLKDYWDVATFFEISVLAENYNKACVAASACSSWTRPPGTSSPPSTTSSSSIGSGRRKEIERREPQP